MLKITTLLEILHVDQEIDEIRPAMAINTITLLMKDGTIIHIEKVPLAKKLLTHKVAYFGYPSSSTSNFRYHRRVIVTTEDHNKLCGYESSNEQDYAYKMFIKEKAIGLEIVDEVLSDTDKAALNV